MTELKLDVQGRLWSDELNCYLVQDKCYLRLYERDGKRILTTRERLAAEQKARQRLAKQMAAEKKAKEEFTKQAEAERDAKEAAIKAREELLEKLRKAGLDPDKF